MNKNYKILNPSFFRKKHTTWVIKIGSGVLFKDNKVDQNAFNKLIETVVTLRKSGREIILVSSGAVAFGRQILNGADKNKNLSHLQALAAIGQPKLIHLYEDAFAQHNINIAQVLFGRDDLNDRARYLNAEETITALLASDVLPIINENDSVSTEELRFGDNDELGAMTCGLVSADVFVMFSVADGIREIVNGKLGEIIPSLGSEDPLLETLALPIKSERGRGGMQSKIAAAKLAAKFDIPTLILSGKRSKLLLSLVGLSEEKKSFEGTLISPEGDALRGPKIWLTAAARSVGEITCDLGAIHAIRTQGSSLLAAGILSIEGPFLRGEVVELVDKENKVFARGVSTYNSDAIEKIAGKKSTEIFETLGYKISDAIIHRDSLVILDIKSF